VFILKDVKVVCFVTLLQVLNLKGVIERGGAGRKAPKQAAGDTPHPGCPVVAFGIPHTPVFCKKSPDLLDSKGVDFFENDKEAARVSE
jgi:hypothetical protein